MAEAFLGVLMKNLSSLIQKEIGLIIGADNEMKKLSSTLNTIHAVLEDAEDRQFESEPIRNWLRKLNDLAFQIDDLLDECGIEVSKLQKKNNKFRSLKKILYQHKIGRRMKEMVKKLDGVAAEREKFHFRETSFERQTEVIARRAIRETGSVLNEPHKVYGRDEEKKKIVDILVNRVKDNEQLSILPIIGLGGLGKTTLAQIVYNDQRIKEHFDLKMWVCVSDDFDPKILIKAMLNSGKEGGCASDSMPLDSLQHRLWEKLHNKRYLLILDDVWNEDQEEWAKLKNVLACGSRGASIVVTTRLKNVADIMGTVPAHCLSVLSEEHCWLLFKQCAFGEQAEEHPNLEAIGRQTMKKCGGVPLAAKTLGGLLRFKRKEKDWIHIKESELWNLEQKKNSVLPSLRLSYRHLPLVLRRCFAYCALFPKDAEIEKDKLIYHWMAHGCISSNGIQEVEDVGDEVWNELVLRSLFQEVSTRSYDGKIICKMHDLVHDLALSIMENQVPRALASNSPTTAPGGKIRQILVSDRFMTLPTSIQLQVPTSTSLVNFYRVRFLTAWRLPNTEAQLSSISKLKQLRHLVLSYSSIQTLPNTICDLQNLQILNLNWCYNLVRLPKNMRYMDSLRHLFLEGCDSLIAMPSRIGDLTCLKTLSQFIVSDKRGNQLCELEHLNLGGKLEVKHLERVKNQLDARKTNLCEKPNLRDLVLKWDGENASESREMMDKMVLEALEPHPNIETFRIFGFKGKVFPLWMENATMDNVIDIKIDNCPNCLRLPQLALLPRLKSLALFKLDMIEFVCKDEVQGGNAFSSLKDLQLQSLPNLKGLLKKEWREMFPNLQFLRIYGCPSLRLPPLPSIKKLDADISSHSNLSSFSTLHNLTSLSLKFNKNTLTCIPTEALESLFNLEELSICNAHEHIMPVEHIRCLKSLTSLFIQMREAVTCVPGEWFQQLTTLKGLSIWACHIIELPYEIKYLHSLQTLNLGLLPKMVCLPEGLQHLPSLQNLWLQYLDELTSLPDWLDKLFSLEWLVIWKCPKIGSLPSCIRRMTNLRSLGIYECPELRRRCEKGKGEDWHNIAHILKLDID